MIRPTSSRLAAVAVIGLLAGCALDDQTTVQKATGVDQVGRNVTYYKVCETTGIPVLPDKAIYKKTKCHVEMVPQHYCYRSLGKIDCYTDPVPGLSASRVSP